MSINFSIKKIVSSYMLILILFFCYNMLQLPKAPYFAIRFLIMLMVAFYAFGIMTKNSSKCSGMRLFVGYFVYLLFSFLFIFAYGYPVSLIPDAVMSGLFPMLFFFVGAAEKKESLFEAGFYKYYFWGCIFMFVCSIYLFVASPSWYIEWKRAGVLEEWEDSLMVIGSMSGFSVTSYLVGYSSLFAFCYLIFKFKNKIANNYDYVLLFIVVFCLIFAQARVAILAAIIIVLWYSLTTLSLKNLIIMFIIITPFVYFMIKIISNNEWLSTMFDVFSNKVQMASEDKRYETGLKLLSEQTNYIFGHGYGAGGHKANTLGLPSVTDFEFVKLFYETGIVGFVLFLVIVLKAIRKKPRFSFESFIILFYLLAMLVANPLTADGTMSPVFWYTLGRVVCSDSSNKLKQNNMQMQSSIVPI